jgi:hypothetical protein
MEDWQEKAEVARKRKELQTKYPLLGKKVRRKNRSKWEEGFVVFDEEDDELYIEYSENDWEQLMGLPFEVWDEGEGKWVKGVF